MTRALVPARVVVQVQLVVLLRIPPLSRRDNLRHDLALVPLLVRQLRDLLGGLALLLVVEEDGAAVLRAGVG